MKFSLFLTVLFFVVTALASIAAADPEPAPVLSGEFGDGSKGGHGRFRGFGKGMGIVKKRFGGYGKGQGGFGKKGFGGYGRGKGKGFGKRGFGGGS